MLCLALIQTLPLFITRATDAPRWQEMRANTHVLLTLAGGVLIPAG